MYITGKYVPHVRTGREVSFVWLFPFVLNPGVLYDPPSYVLFYANILDLLPSCCSWSTTPQLAHWFGTQSQFDSNGKQVIGLSEDRRG